MTDSDPAARRAAAVRALVDRDPGRAGDLYTLVGRGVLAGREAEGHDRDLLADDATYAGYGFRYLLLAALAYRATGNDRRARLRAREGTAVAADYASVFESTAERACCFEAIGDFGAAAGLADDGSDAYDRAVELYRDADASDPLSRATDPLFEAVRLGPQQAARNTSHRFDWDDLHGTDPSSGEYLAHRARFKRSRVPAIASTVAESGFLAPPRGTTEHNNAVYVCPECGRSEVNWIAGMEVCLDCDVPMREQ